jgi:general L-amino acid transport system ATP-binding protein
MNDQSKEDRPIIIARDVNKWFDGFQALKGVSMEVMPGEVVVIFGPSGSGKSTFIRTLNRLEEHQRGTIIIDGIELSHDVRNVEQIRREIDGFPAVQPVSPPHRVTNITLAPIWCGSAAKPKQSRWRCSCWSGWVSRAG